MAQATDRLILRRNIKLVGGKHLIFDKGYALWRVAFYRPRRDKETGHYLKPTLQDSMERAAMLPKMPRNFWVRVTTQSPTLRSGIFAVLEEGDSASIFNDVISYIEGVEWSWYLDR